MKIKFTILLIIVVAIFLMDSCKKDEDTEGPKINLISPANCDSILQGDFIEFKATFTDNQELAKYAIDIHNNFTHISFAPSDQGCDFGPDKSTFNPFKYVVLEDIPPGLNAYTAEFKIIVPEGTDEGDYLLVVYAQDNKGIQSQYSISLKLYNNDR